MTNHVLNPGDRAALEGLIALAGVLGVGALLARFFPDRKGAREQDVGFTVFEVFSVIAILTTAGVTAYSSVLFLHQGEAITNDDFTRAAAPLVVSLVLLVLLVAFARFSRLPGGPWAHMSTLTATLVMAVAAGSIAPLLALRPEDIVAVGVSVLALGACFAWLFLRLERFIVGGRERQQRERVAKLSAAGFRPMEKELQPVVPTILGDASVPVTACWTKGGRIYLDQPACEQLQRDLDRRWAKLARGEALAPLGETMLSRIETRTFIAPWSPKFLMVLTMFERDRPDALVHKLEVEDNGLFELTKLGIV